LPGTAENSDQEGGTAESAAYSEEEKGSSPMAMEEVVNDVSLDARDDAGVCAGKEGGEQARVDEACDEWVDVGNDAGSYEEEAAKPVSDQEDHVAEIETKCGDEGEDGEASTTDLKEMRPSDNTTETTTESGVAGSGFVPNVDKLSAVPAAEAPNSGERSAEEYGLDDPSPGPSPMDET
jgi:hypothetical protein